MREQHTWPIKPNSDSDNESGVNCKHTRFGSEQEMRRRIKASTKEAALEETSK